MKPLELLRIVWINMVQNKFKVLLTSLGIIVGTVTIVLVIAIGQGGEAQAAERYSGLSADTIYINPDYQNMDFDASKIEKLTPEILEKIKEENSGLTGLYLRSSAYREAQFGRQKEPASIEGVTGGYSEISSLEFESGSDFSEEDMEDGKNVVVIGNGIVTKYYQGPDDALNKNIKIDGKKYKIIGTLKRSEDGLQGLNPDDSIFMPYETLKKNELINEYSIPQAVGKGTSLDTIKTAMAQLESSLDYYMEDGSVYKVEDAGSRIEAATASARTMKMLLVSVAVIVFIVGGIGIMNVLFVTIKERTKEIGVLKALGSTKVDILLQFLLESVAIGIFGGIVGVVLSFLAMTLMGATDIPLVSSVGGRVVALSFAVLTSTVFGFYPAYKASQLKPVDALNYE